jgi:hypothetical protein
MNIEILLSSNENYYRHGDIKLRRFIVTRHNCNNIIVQELAKKNIQVI